MVLKRGGLFCKEFAKCLIEKTQPTLDHRLTEDELGRMLHATIEDVRYVEEAGLLDDFVKTCAKHSDVPLTTIVNYKDRYGFTPLLRTIAHQNRQLTEELLILGADVNQESFVTPLMRAAREQNGDEIVALLLEPRFNCDIDRADHDGMTALMYACLYGTVRSVEKLLAAGASVHATTKAQQTPLMFAVFQGVPEMLSALFKARAPLNVRDVNGETALSYCSYAKPFFLFAEFSYAKSEQYNPKLIPGNVDITTNMSKDRSLKILLKQKGDYLKYHSPGSMLLYVIRRYEPQLLECLFSSGFHLPSRINVLNEIVDALCVDKAGERGTWYEITKALAGRGFLAPLDNADPFATDPQRCDWSVHFLRHAIKDQSNWSVDFVLRLGVEVNRRDREGRTPLITCIQSGTAGSNASSDLVRMLQYGADPNYPGITLESGVPGESHNSRLFSPLAAATMSTRAPTQMMAIVWTAGGALNQDTKEHDYLVHDFWPNHANDYEHLEECSALLHHLIHKPRTLLDICRIRIRKVLGHNLQIKLRKLAVTQTLPPSLLTFLTHIDLGQADFGLGAMQL